MRLQPFEQYIAHAGQEPNWSLWTQVGSYLFTIPAHAGSVPAFVFADFHLTDNDNQYINSQGGWMTYVDNIGQDFAYEEQTNDGLEFRRAGPSRFTYAIRVFNSGFGGSQVGYWFGTKWGRAIVSDTMLSMRAFVVNFSASPILHRVELWVSAFTVGSTPGGPGGALPLQTHARSIVFLGAR